MVGRVFSLQPAPDAAMESVGLFVGLFHPQSCAGLSLSLISRDPFTMVCCMKPLSGQVAVVAGGPGQEPELIATWPHI